MYWFACFSREFPPKYLWIFPKFIVYLELQCGYNKTITSYHIGAVVKHQSSLREELEAFALRPRVCRQAAFQSPLQRTAYVS